MTLEGWIYLASGMLTLAVPLVYLGRERAKSRAAAAALAESRASGLDEPPSLHPRIDPQRCIGSGACVKACPEQTVLGLVGNRAVLINASACIGHGACEAACPVEAIDLVFGTARRGIDIPRVTPTFETNVPGLFIAGELGGMGLIRNALSQGRQAARAIMASLEGAAAADPGQVDLLVVGAGPAGIAATLEARAAGLETLVLDQDTPGGAIAHYPRRKLVMTQPLRLPGLEPLKVREIEKEPLLAYFERAMTIGGLDPRCGWQVTKVERRGTGFAVLAVHEAGGRREFTARRVLLAIGRRGSPRRLGVPGEESPQVCYQLRDAGEWSGRRALVVGGGDSAIEAALQLSPVAAETRLVYRGGAINRAKAGNRQRLGEAVDRGRLELLLNSEVREILAGAVRLATPTGERQVGADGIFVLIGGELPTALLRDAGIEIETHRGELRP
jgi:thioredoxin reductase (NADPH)